MARASNGGNGDAEWGMDFSSEVFSKLAEFIASLELLLLWKKQNPLWQKKRAFLLLVCSSKVSFARPSSKDNPHLCYQLLTLSLISSAPLFSLKSLLKGSHNEAMRSSLHSRCCLKQGLICSSGPRWTQFQRTLVPQLSLSTLVNVTLLRICQHSHRLEVLPNPILSQ